jgi:hypothetical protein
VNREPAKFEQQRKGQIGVADGICIPAHRFDRGDFGELSEDAVADIAGMNDQLDAIEGVAHSGPHEAVSVGNQSDDLAIRWVIHSL